MKYTDMLPTNQRILIGALKLFLCKNLDRVTIKDIELATGCTRGSIFYHFDSKLHIFKEVIDNMYFIHFKDDFFSLSKDDYSLKNFFVSYANPCQRIITYIDTIKLETTSSEKAFLHLTSQANIYYPDFSAILEKYLIHEKDIIYNFLKSKNLDSIPDERLNAISLLVTDLGYSQILKSAFGIGTEVQLGSYYDMFFRNIGNCCTKQS